MKRVLVTGATGFIGRQCLPLLMGRGYEVHAVSSRPVPQNGAMIQWHRVDLLEQRQISVLMAEVRPSHLLHLAWYTAPGRYWTSPENLRWVQSSLGVLQDFARNGGRRIVVAGTCAEYDWRYGYCSEGVTPLAPTTLYGTCKNSLHLMLSEFSQQTGLSAAWGRIFFLFGPHEHPDRLVALVVSSLLRGETAPCTPGTQIRDLLYVEDVASAFVALLDSSVSGPVNIASGTPVALRDLILKIGDLQGRPDLIQLGAVPIRTDDPPLLVADVRRLRDEVGWQPKHSMNDALAQTIRWWEERSSNSAFCAFPPLRG